MHVLIIRLNDFPVLRLFISHELIENIVQIRLKAMIYLIPHEVDTLYAYHESAWTYLKQRVDPHNRKFCITTNIRFPHISILLYFNLFPSYNIGLLSLRTYQNTALAKTVIFDILVCLKTNVLI